MRDKGIWKQDPEENIWAQEGCELGVEKAPQRGASVIKSRRLRWPGHVAEWRKVGELSKF